MKNFLIYLAFALVLLGCATNEYNQAEGECSASAFQRFPVKNVQEVVSRSKEVQVPTGRTNCTSTPNGAGAINTTCTQETKSEWRNYQDVETLDGNKKARDSLISSCTAQRCMSRYGNSQCKNTSSNFNPSIPSPLSPNPMSGKTW